MPQLFKNIKNNVFALNKASPVTSVARNLFVGFLIKYIQLINGDTQQINLTNAQNLFFTAAKKYGINLTQDAFIPIIEPRLQESDFLNTNIRKYKGKSPYRIETEPEFAKWTKDLIAALKNDYPSSIFTFL
jgi:hypothetical protein